MSPQQVKEESTQLTSSQHIHAALRSNANACAPGGGAAAALEAEAEGEGRPLQRRGRVPGLRAPELPAGSLESPVPLAAAHL